MEWTLFNRFWPDTVSENTLLNVESGVLSLTKCVGRHIVQPSLLEAYWDLKCHHGWFKKFKTGHHWANHKIAPSLVLFQLQTLVLRQVSLFYLLMYIAVIMPKNPKARACKMLVIKIFYLCVCAAQHTQNTPSPDQQRCGTLPLLEHVQERPHYTEAKRKTFSRLQLRS